MYVNASLDQLTSVSVHELYNYVCEKKFDKDIQKAVRIVRSRLVNNLLWVFLCSLCEKKAIWEKGIIHHHLCIDGFLAVCTAKGLEHEIKLL